MLDAAHAGHADRLERAFAAEEQEGLALVIYVRFIVIGILTIWVLLIALTKFAVVYIAIITIFGVSGALPLLLRHFGVLSIRRMAVFIALDVLILTYILMVPGSMFPSTLTPQFNLQLPNFLYLCLFVVGMAISYSPGLVVWTGAVAIVAWSAGMIWIVSLPDSLAYAYSELLDPTKFTDEERVRTTSSRLFVSLTHWYNRVLFLGLMTLIIALAVWRSRRLLRKQIASEAARASLSRYFSPNMVDGLSSGDSTLEEVKAQKVAVLFVDIAGFTGIAELLGPQRVILMLRSYHRRMARTVFQHHGTIDKYIGDALMANFGTPETGPHDASNALRCAHAMLRELQGWNAKRRERGAEAIQVGIGVHYGEIVAGNIGAENLLEYAVLGDTANVASRIERLTRELDSHIVVSSELVARVREEADDAAELLAALVEDRTVTVRGRTEPVSVWKLAKDPADAI